jgi:rod shape determining protein RodA
MVDLNRRSIRDVDWLLLLAPIALTLLGGLGIYSTAGVGFLKKQLIALAIGVAIAVVVMFTDYRKIVVTIAPFFYALTIVLLILVLFVGIENRGNKAWLNLAGFSLQPSEFAKVATILMLARYMAHPREGPLSLRDIVILGLITAPPIVLIYLENDTGTMLTFGAILGGFYFIGGMRKRLVVAGVVALALGLVAVYPHLKGYQKERVDVILHPERADPKGYGYQTIQSMIAVGSGGVLGKGVGQGTQGRLGFVPQAHSDFVGAVIAEETGFVGVLLMMVLYLLLIWRLFVVAAGARDRAGALMIIGFVSLIAFHILCNLGMVVGLLPIMGIPLPLMSSGGTSVMAMFMCIGLALSVKMRRFVN